METSEWQETRNIAFTEDECNDILEWMEEGNIIKCNRCGTKNHQKMLDLQPENNETIRCFKMECSVCSRCIERSILVTITDIPEHAAHAALIGGEEMTDGEPEFIGMDFGKVEARAMAHMVKEGIVVPPDESKDTWEDPNKAGNKYMAGVIADFAPALKEVAKLGSMNNKPHGKYERGSWKLVENPEVMYNDAFWRHLLEDPHAIDPTTGMPHDVAIAWNALALVYFRLRREGKIND